MSASSSGCDASGRAISRSAAAWCGRPASQPASAAASSRRARISSAGERGGALEGRGGGRVAAPAPGPVRRALELLGDLGVGLGGRGGEVPGAAVGVLLSLQQVGEHLVHLLALWQARPLVDGRANQRVPELDARLSETNQPGRLGGAEGGGLDPHLPRAAQHDGGIAGVVGSGDQEEGLALRGKAARSLEKRGLERRADRQWLGQRRPPGELVLAQEPRQLEQGERVAAGALQQALSQLG